MLASGNFPNDMLFLRRCLFVSRTNEHQVSIYLFSIGLCQLSKIGDVSKSRRLGKYVSRMSSLLV